MFRFDETAGRQRISGSRRTDVSHPPAFGANVKRAFND